MISQWKLPKGMDAHASYNQNQLSESSTLAKAGLAHTVHSTYEAFVEPGMDPTEASYADEWAEQEAFLRMSTEELMSHVLGSEDQPTTPPDSVSTESPHHLLPR